MDDHIISVEVSGKTFYIIEKEYVEQMIKETYPKFERSDFVYLIDDLYLHKGFTRGTIYEAIFGNWITYDHAVPQNWFNANLATIRERGGCVWVYLPGDSLGRPYYDDMAMCTLKTLIRRALEDKE